MAVTMKRWEINRRPVTHLIEAIGDGDIQKCRDLVENMNKRQVNKLKRPKDAGDHYNMCVVTPLVWAVMNNRHDIAELLLSKGADVNRLGYYESKRIVNKLSPLLRAIDHHDERMIELLLKYGANIYMAIPGPRLIEEEGGSVRYHRYFYPVDYCFSKSVNVYKKVLNHVNMAKEYGIFQHTCFCSTVNNYLRGNDNNMGFYNSLIFVYVYLALQYGGKVCSGRQQRRRDFSYAYCTYIYDLLTELSQFVKEGPMCMSLVRLINCLYLVCCSDYMHRQSSMYIYPKLLARRISIKDTSKLECATGVDRLALFRLNWILQMPETPSTLQVIARATIRKHLKSCTPSDCRNLPLPAKLIDFVSYETTEGGILFLKSLSMD